MTRVWIDTDMGFDDLAAIVTVTADPNLEIAGLSLVAGNAPLDVVAANAAGAAATLGWRMPICLGRAAPVIGAPITAAGVLGPTGMRSVDATLPAASLPTSPAAFDALTQFLQATDERPTLLALGPLTNIAVLLLARPDLAPRIGRLLWMGGSAGPGNHTAAAEFNAAADPEAVAIVLDAGVTLSMVGLDLCRQVPFTSADAATLRAAGTATARILADLFEGYCGIAGARPMALYDAVAAAALTDPASVSFAPAHIAMELAGRHSRGATVVEWRVPTRAAANAEVAVAADANLIRTRVLGALLGAAQQRGGI